MSIRHPHQPREYPTMNVTHTKTHRRRGSDRRFPAALLTSLIWSSVSGAANAQQIAAELLEVWKEPNSNGHRLTFGIQFGPDVTLLDRDIIRITYETIPIDHGGVVAGIPSDVWLPQNGPTQVHSSDYSPTTMIATLGVASGIYDNRLTPAGAVVPTQVSFKGISITGGNSAPYTTPSASTYGFVINDVNINNAVINPIKVSLERPIRPSGPYDGQTSVLLEGEVTFRGRTLEKGSGPFAGAGSYVCCGATDDVPPAKFVPGKEYSDRADTNQKGETTPEQTLLWDGLGNVKDGFRYGTSGRSGCAPARSGRSAASSPGGTARCPPGVP